MQFKILSEIVGGVKRFQQAETPIKDLGQHGWFHVYSVPESHIAGDEYGTRLYHPDAFAEKFDGSILKEASAKLQQFGFRKINSTVIFTDFVLPIGAEGTNEKEIHIIRVKKELDPKRMLHVIIHEWAHNLWRSMPKDDKTSFTHYYFISFSKSSIGGYALSGGPQEKFCELITEAVTNPQNLSAEELKLVKMIASNIMPKFDVKSAS